MTQRAYTLDEIDRMRVAVAHFEFPTGRTVEEFQRRIEDLLRTYMLGGVSVEELEARAKEIVTKGLR